MITVHPNVQHAGPAEHLMWVREAKRAVQIPVVASLNAVNNATWIEYAKRLEQTGVDGLECNLFASPRDPAKVGAAIENEQIDLIARLKETVALPISVKLGVFYSQPLNVIHRMSAAGAAAFVLFNRFMEPDIDIAQEELIAAFNLSHDTDYRLPLRYAGLLEGTISADICGSTGIFTGAHVIKMILAGANAVQTVSAVFRHGFGHIQTMLGDMAQWMDGRGYKSLADFRGKLSKRTLGLPWAYGRAQYARLLMDPQELINAVPLL
jgi:dihydroorotate dehydrogenase (fumarate)